MRTLKLDFLPLLFMALIGLPSLTCSAEEADSTRYNGSLEIIGDEIREIYECEVPYICMEDGYPVDSGTIEAQLLDPDDENDCQDCVALAGCQNNGYDCYYGTQTCCTSMTPTGDCANEGGLKPICHGKTLATVRRYRYSSDGLSNPIEFSLIVSQGTIYEFTGVGLSSNKSFHVSATDRKRAWTQFKSFASRHGGLLPGSLKTRIAPSTLYRCYVRLKSRDGNVLYDQQVEGAGTASVDAILGAMDAAADMKSYLTDVAKHTDVEILAGYRLLSERNTARNACRESVQCRHRCLTAAKQLTIETSRFGRTRATACAAAEAAAEAIADNNGGVVPGTCRNLPPIGAAAGKLPIAEDCEGCGNDDSTETPSDAKQDAKKS